jgi:tetratricopeptide (TPR) repeat protein
MNLFHQLIHKELTPISKFQSNPAYFFLHTFLSGFLEDCHFIKTKFNLLNLVLSNPFITKEHKEQIKESIKNLTYKKLSTFNRLDENNINLNYLAGFSHEMTGDFTKAEEYYKVILTINPNNYEANFALGLLYLNLYLDDKEQTGMMYISKYYLTKANEIDPNELKVLNALSILYKNTGEKSELQKINNRINQLKLN